MYKAEPLKKMKLFGQFWDVIRRENKMTKKIRNDDVLKSINRKGVYENV